MVPEILRQIFPGELCQDRNLIPNFLIILAVFTSAAPPVRNNGDNIKYICRYLWGKGIYPHTLINFVSSVNFRVSFMVTNEVKS